MVIKLASFWEKFDPKRLLHVGIPLTGAISIADGVTEAAFEKDPSKRGKVFRQGLAKGAVYGATLSVAEHALGHPIGKLLAKTNIPGTLVP